MLSDGGSGNVAGFRNNRGNLAPLAGSVQPLSAAGGTGPDQVAIGTEGDVLVVTEKATSRLVSYALSAYGIAGAPRAPAVFSFAVDTDRSLSPIGSEARAPAQAPEGACGWRKSPGAIPAHGSQACHGLITAAPAASKGPVSRVATAKPLTAAMAAM